MKRLLGRIGLTNWIRITTAGVVFLVFFSVGSVELTSQSWFCNSCHIMNTYYESWSKGKHKDVACVQCHIAPGVTNFVAAKLNGLGQVVDDVLSRTSTKPSASVSQFSCTRSGCHTMEKVRATEKTTGAYKFTHDKHLNLESRGITLSCSACHSHVKGDEHFEVNTEICLTCHLVASESPVYHQPEDEPRAGIVNGVGGGGPIRMTVREEVASGRAGDDPRSAAAPTTGEAVVIGPVSHEKLPPTSCVTCHDPPKGVIERGGLKIDHSLYLSYGARCESCHRGTTGTPQPIEDGRCLQCHTFGVERRLPVSQMHKVHIEGKHKIECLSCHGSIQHGPSAMDASLAQFDCRRCHTDQHNVQRRTYLSNGDGFQAGNGAALPPAVSPMFMAHVDCTGCHISRRAVHAKPDSGAQVAAAVAEACDRCHQEGLGAKMIPLWQKGTHELYDEVAAELEAAGKAGASKRVIEDVGHLLEMVRVDGSWGVHNPRYTQHLLEQARERLVPGAPGAPGASPGGADEGKDRSP